MSNSSEENQPSTSTVEGDPAEETIQVNASESSEHRSATQVPSTDSNDKAMFPNPYLPEKASGAPSADGFDSPSVQDLKYVGNEEMQSSASIILSSTASVMVHIDSCHKSPEKLMTSSPDSASSVDSFDSVSVEDSPYISHVESQSSESVRLSSTANIMVHISSRDTPYGVEVAVPRLHTTPTEANVDVAKQDTIKALFERLSLLSDSSTQVHGQEAAVHGAPMSKNLSSAEIKIPLNEQDVDEKPIPKEKSTDTSKKHVGEPSTAENKMQLKEKSKSDKSQVKLTEQDADESKMRLREQVADKSKLRLSEQVADESNLRLSEQVADESKMRQNETKSAESEIMLSKQEASASKMQQDPASAETIEQDAANSGSDEFPLSPEIPPAPSVTSDSTSQLPEASSSTQPASSRYPPRKVKLTAACLPSWRNLTMVQARRGRGMYSKPRPYGEDSPPKEKRISAFARHLPEINVQNINRGIRGDRFQQLIPPHSGQPPYRSLSERLFLETMAKVRDITREKKKKLKKKRRSRHACAEEADEDSWTSWSSDDEPKSPKKSIPPSPELQFHLEL